MSDQEHAKVLREMARWGRYAPRIYNALVAGAAALERTDEPAEAIRLLPYAIAQLRHAYHNLTGPDGPWDRNQRMRFADGLIGPQIEKLERLNNLLQPAPPKEQP